ncbi:ABC transporter substrate-binding protein [Nocardioides pantholopis]|uniref:ABC transporter substrate-binding protein n=1 Tax=Nocardioides pantholopis TaxID=2483798 RepID=UPI000F08B0E7|nr:ABC transporter substrate-binding protein [Nocardioides pantholopis]
MRLTRRPTRRGVPALLAVALLLTAAACGTSDDSDDEAAGDQPTGDPVRIGLFDPSAGGYKSLGVGVGARAGVDYVNSELGGIHDRPVELVSCATDGTPETTISCANKFAEDEVVAALDGFNTTSSSAIDILTTAGIPLVGGIPFDSATGAEVENRVFFSAPQAAFLIGALQAFSEEGKKSVTLVAADIPATHQSVDLVLKPVGAALGIEVEGLYFSPTNPNFNAIASTIKETDPDVGGLMAAPDPSVCTKLVQGLRQLGYEGTIFTAACTEFIDQAPAEAAGAALYSSHWLPRAADYAPEDVQEQLEVAEEAISEEGGTADFYAFAQLGVTATLAEALNASPDAALDGPTILATLKGLEAFPSFLGPELTCGGATTPNCTSQMLLFNVDDQGATEPVTGEWITPLPDILAKIPGAS